MNKQLLHSPHQSPGKLVIATWPSKAPKLGSRRFRRTFSLMRQQELVRATCGSSHITQKFAGSQVTLTQRESVTYTRSTTVNERARCKREQKTLFACIRRTTPCNPLSSKDALADRIYLRMDGHKTQTRQDQTTRPRTLTPTQTAPRLMISNMAYQRGQADRQT